MSDLISRQAAIDAIDKALSRTFIEPCGEMILKDLPSAQPEIIRCKDCMWWDTSWKPTRAIEGAYWCSNNDIYMESDDYCSLAERKEE